MEVIVNKNCDINSAIFKEKIEKVQQSSSITLNSTILKQQCNNKTIIKFFNVKYYKTVTVQH